MSQQESLDEIRQLNETLRELRNYQGTQIQLQASSQTDLSSQLRAIHDTSEQVNQALLTSLRRLERSSDRQRAASEQVIERGYKAFQESVEQTANRNETQLRKLQDEQRQTNSQLLKMQSEQNERIETLGASLNRHVSEAADSLDRQSRDCLKRMSDRMSWYQIRNYLIATIPTSLITVAVLMLVMHFLP
jgi:flagellar biosynthesis GTPase FlhF